MGSRRLPQDLEPLALPRDWRPWPAELDPRAPSSSPAAGGTLPVSVVVAAFNREALIGRALASVFTQRPALAAEVVVVDDGSTDGTAAEAERLGARVVRLERNRGAAAARNAGVEAATQPWIALLDSDDEWLPHLLASLWPLRDDHVLVSGSSLSLGAEPSADRIGGVPVDRPLLLRSPAALVFPHNFVASSGVLVRRGAIIAAGGYRTDLRYAEDFDLWLRILRHGTGVVSPAVVSVYHRHTGQKSRDVGAPRVAQRAAIASQASARWWSAHLLERRIAVDAWDDLRTAVRQRRLAAAARHAGTLLRRPARLRAVAAVVGWREAQKRRSSMVARDGGPTVGLLPGAPSERAGTRPVVDLRGARWPRIATVLLRRPPGTVACGSARAAAVARRLGSEPIWIADHAAPRASPLRMASFPTAEGAPPPYVQLLHGALAAHDVDLLPAARLDPSLAHAGSGRPDVVHLHWIEYIVRSGGTGAAAGIRAAVRTARLVAGLWALRRAGTAIVWTVHNLRAHESRHPRLEHAAMRATARFANTIVVHSEHARRQVESTYGHGRELQVLPHGNFTGYYPPPRRSRHELRAALGLPDETFTFLVFGQVRGYKRIPEMVAAFRQLRGADVALIVAGSAWDPIERSAVQAAADGDPRIRLRLEFVPDEEVAELHVAADAAVLGYREVFSSGALLLALSLGLPAVVPDHGSALEVAQPPAVEPFQAGRLVEALEAIRTGDQAARRAAAHAAAGAADWDAIAQRTAAIYREAVSEAARRNPGRASRR
jgi:beta-1,4-mannosyltransferase